jgi:hypothetical protein
VPRTTSHTFVAAAVRWFCHRHRPEVTWLHIAPMPPCYFAVRHARRGGSLGTSKGVAAGRLVASVPSRRDSIGPAGASVRPGRPWHGSERSSRALPYGGNSKRVTGSGLSAYPGSLIGRTAVSQTCDFRLSNKLGWQHS